MKQPIALSAQPLNEFTTRSRSLFARLACFVLGHHFDNRISFKETSGQCQCGESLINEDGLAVHVRHNLVCLLGGHTYEKIGERDGHCEYVCESCGHPMLFAMEASPYARQDHFRKFVRPQCGLAGHEVHIVTERGGMTEYACDCGHSFLLLQSELTKVRHPLTCLLTGHSIKPFARLDGIREFRCENCGHPFCLTATIKPISETVDRLPAGKAALSNIPGINSLA